MIKLHIRRSLNKLSNIARDFVKNDRGNLTVMMAVAGLPIILAVGYALDYSRATSSQFDIKIALDSAALAAVMPTDLSDDERASYAEETFYKNYSGEAEVSVNVEASRDIVKITGTGTIQTLASGAIGIEGIQFRDSSTAVLTKADVVCILALDPTGKDALEFKDQARFRSPACSVQVNSSHASALKSSLMYPAIAKSFCTSGASVGTFSPNAKHDCSPIEDPYANLIPPVDGQCLDLDKLTVKEFNQNGVVDIYDVIDDGAILYPGTYCKGLKIEGVNVRFLPGTYIIKGKKLEFKKGAQARGNDVTFVLKGSKAALKIESGANLYLSAPSDGPYKGLAFYQTDIDDDKKSKKPTKSEIGSDGGLTLIGTAYFPTQELVIKSETGVAAQSPATAFIAYRLRFEGKSVVSVKVDHEYGGIPPLLPRSDEGAKLIR